LIKARQGKNDVRDFQRDLETPAIQFSDVTERKIRQIFWTGLGGYLHLHLIGNGLKPERNSIQKVVKYDSRHEAARRTFKFGRNNLAWRSRPNVAYFSRTNAGIECFSWENQANGTRESESDNESAESSDVTVKSLGVLPTLADGRRMVGKNRSAPDAQRPMPWIVLEPLQEKSHHQLEEPDLR
jgi:hypothetical protein